MQRTLLDPDIQAPLRVYAVWFNMYPGDARARWRDTLLTDPRVRHYWDDQGLLGRLYLHNMRRMWPVRAAGTEPPQDDALSGATVIAPESDRNRDTARLDSALR